MGFLDRFSSKGPHEDERRWQATVASSQFLTAEAAKPGTVRRLKALRLAMDTPEAHAYGSTWDARDASTLAAAVQRFPANYSGSPDDIFGRSLSVLKMYLTETPFEISMLAEAMGATNPTDRGPLSALTLGVLSEVDYLTGGNPGPWMDQMAEKSTNQPVYAEMSAWIAMALARLFEQGPMKLDPDTSAFLETLS